MNPNEIPTGSGERKGREDGKERKGNPLRLFDDIHRVQREIRKELREGSLTEDERAELQKAFDALEKKALARLIGAITILGGTTTMVLSVGHSLEKWLQIGQKTGSYSFLDLVEKVTQNTGTRIGALILVTTLILASLKKD